MGLLDKLLGKEKKQEAAVDTGPCPHTDLVPRWDAVDDMGKEEKIHEFECASCQERFSADEGRRLRERSDSGLRDKLGSP